MTFLGAFFCLLLGATGQADLTVAVADANRSRPELRGSLGYLVTLDLIRLPTNADAAYGVLLVALHNASVEAMRHHAPVEVQARLGSRLPRAVPPLSDVVFNFVQPPASDYDRVSDDQRVVRPIRLSQPWQRFPSVALPWGAGLEFEFVAGRAGAMSCTFTYDQRAFGDRAADVIRDLARVLTALARDGAEQCVGELCRHVTPWWSRSAS